MPMGVSPISGPYLTYSGAYNYAVVDSIEKAKGLATRTATYSDLMGQLMHIFLTKIDIEGGEAGALDSIVNALAAGRRVSNIIVE